MDGLSRLKIFIFFFQTSAILLRESIQQAQTVNKSGGTNFLTVIFAVFNMDVSLIPNECFAPMDVFEKFWLVLCSPFIFFCVYASIYFFEKVLLSGSCFDRAPRFIAKYMNNNKKNVRYRNAFVAMCLFVYAPIMQTVLSMLECRELFPGSGVERLTIDPSVECAGPKYSFYRGFSIFLACVLIYPLPVYLLVYIYHLRKTYAFRMRLMEERYAILFAPYMRRMYWWEVCMQLRKTLVVTMFVFMTNQGDRLLVFTFLIFLIMFLHIHFLPLTSRGEDRIELSSLAVLGEWVCASMKANFVPLMLTGYCGRWQRSNAGVSLATERRHQSSDILLRNVRHTVVGGFVVPLRVNIAAKAQPSPATEGRSPDCCWQCVCNLRMTVILCAEFRQDRQQRSGFE